MDTLRSVAHLQRELGNELFAVLISSDHTEKVRRFAESLRPVQANINVADYFTQGTEKRTETKISWLSDNFKKWFFLLQEKVEAELALPIFHHDLTRNSWDEEILTDLGGEEYVKKHPSTIRGIYEILLKHAQGEETSLLTNGAANIFYVCDYHGILRAVRVYWRADGWHVGADSVVDVRGWLADSRVFSCNSAL